MVILVRLCHWGPILALSIVGCISFMTVYCDLMWWPPLESLGGFINIVIFIMWTMFTLSNFMKAAFIGPGFIPNNWKPENKSEETYLQFCQICLGFKAPRSHHCRKCNRCVMKMDHHCPWINNCCGHHNHGYFTCFLCFAVCGCIHAMIILLPSLYRAFNRVWYLYYGSGDEPIVYLGLYGFIFCMFCLGLAIGVILAVGMLLYFQMKSILKNETGIESWIVAKAKRPRANGECFVYPYNLGWKENLCQIYNWNYKPFGNGITWPVVEGCNQYTLTIEQMRQKELKKLSMVQYTIIEDYSGSWFPISKGIKVLFRPPCSDEPRIKLICGDTVHVSRWSKHWLYGEKIPSSLESSLEGKSRIRGWFPRRCAVEILNSDCDFPKLTKKKQ